MAKLVPSRESVDYEHLRAVLTSCVRRSAPAWLADSVDDIVQGAMARLIKKLRSDEGFATPSTSYLMKVAHHAVIDEIRRASRRQETSLPDEEPPGPAPRGAREVAIGDGITDCMTAMAPFRRHAVALYLLGHSVPETAGLLACKLKRAENLVYRGLDDLRRCLRKKGLEP